MMHFRWLQKYVRNKVAVESIMEYIKVTLNNVFLIQKFNKTKRDYKNIKKL